MQIISGIFMQYFSAEIQMRWKSDESDREDGVGGGIRVLGGGGGGRGGGRPGGGWC